jgi:hypothetical protein
MLDVSQKVHVFAVVIQQQDCMFYISLSIDITFYSESLDPLAVNNLKLNG